MGSRRGSMKPYRGGKEEEGEVDLTLKLGLPYEPSNQSHLIRQQVDHNPNAPPLLTNFNISGPYSLHHQEYSNSNEMGMSGGSHANRNPYALVNQEALMNYAIMANHGGNSVMGNMESNPNIGGHNYGNQMGWQQQRSYNENQYYNEGGSVVGIPITSPQNYLNAPLNNYTVMDQSSPAASMADMFQDVGGSSSSSSTASHNTNNNGRRRESRRQRFGNYNDPSKRCSNNNCNTNDTPMWRKGPLGPKTLCNACGIKYRKEVEKKRVKEAASGSNG